MFKENLFDLIRHEDVIIWAGAGLSLYAGFPNGKQLGELLFNSLSQPEKNLINPHLLLPDLAEEICRIKGQNRNFLIRKISSIFSDSVPSSTLTHQMIASIPHFKTIITTNYDRLFEIAYKGEYKLAYSSSHIPYLERKKVELIKVHGDLSEPDSLIITKSDYNNFFRNDVGNHVFWNVVKERLATKSVLFLGYNLEDPNVSVIFDKITETLKANRKECFLVAPNLPQQKVYDLIQKNIHYIDTTAEELIDELRINLLDNISNDLENGIISADTYRTFLKNLGLLPELTATGDTYKLKGIKILKNDVKGKIHFSVKNDESLNDELNAFASGLKFGTLEIPHDKLLSLEMRFGDLKVPFFDQMTKLQFESAPKYSSIVDFVFDDGFEQNGIGVKAFGSQYMIEIIVDLINATLKVNLDPKSIDETKYNFTFQHKEIYTRAKDEIDLFSFLHKIGSGIGFTVYTSNGKKYPFKLAPAKEIVREAEYFIGYFKMLREIEGRYKVRFSDIKLEQIGKSLKLVSKIFKIIRDGKITLTCDDVLVGIKADNSPETLEQIRKIQDLEEITIVEDKEEFVDLCGQKINLGYKNTTYLKPIITNLDSVLNNNDEKIILKSKINTVVVSFSSTPRTLL